MEINNDITERNQTQEALRRAQVELAHINRVMTLGELTASIAHEINQPLAGIVTNGAACLRWLGREPPELDEARGAVESMIGDGMRASDVIQRLRALSRKTDLHKVQLDINDVIDDVIRLVQREAFDHLISLRLELASERLLVLGDRVQLQQVIINLAMNGMEAMASVTDRPRELVIRSRRHEDEQVLIEVQDAGIGIDPVAPADGTVQVVVAEAGEAIRAGQAVLTIETAANRWLSFNIREDRLLGTTVGTRVGIMTAGANGPVSATVTELLPLGQFATWQAERAVGDHDRNTLRMRVEAEGDLARLEPGTTVWLSR